MRTRPDRPLFCIDLAVPRDIEPAVNDLEGVYLYDIDSLQAIADQSMNIRRQELVVCERMIERHVSEFSDWLGGDSRGGATAYPVTVANGQPEGAKP
jgi:glutamyl-tRNA reductase